MNFFARRKTELHDEIETHLQMSVADRIAAGAPPEDARREALREFGNPPLVKDVTRDRWGWIRSEHLLQDCRYAFRTLLRDRGFAAVAILILALGIGANVTVFSVVNTILLRPLPVHEPSRLVWLQPARSHSGLSSATYSADAYEDLRDMNHSYSGVTGYFAFSGPDNVKLDGNGAPQPATAIPVVGNFFQVLGVTPVLGRDFIPADSRNGNYPVALLSYAFWKTHFHGDPSIVGKSVSMNKTPVPVIGVLPEAFDFGAMFNPGTKVDMVFPQVLDDIRYEGNALTLVARLKPNVSVKEATAEAAQLFPQFYWQRRQAASKGSYGAATAVLLPEHVAGQIRRALYVLWGAVGMILLIVCVNLSNLMLARAAARSKEFALRTALGASRGRLVRQLLTEAAILTCAGTLAGLAIAYGATSWLAHQGSIALPLLSTLRIDGSVLLWTLLIAVVSGLLFGLLPGLRMASGNIQEALKDSGPNASDGRKHSGLRSSLVVSEIALACVLVVGAGLLLRSFLRVMDVDLGFHPEHASALALDQPRFRMPDGKFSQEQQNAFFHAVLDRASSVPGIDKAGITDSLPFGLNRSWGAPGVKGVQYGGGGKKDPRPDSFVYVVSPGYLAAMGTPIAGRDFAWSDNGSSGPVMILNRKAADFLFPRGNALGSVLEFGGQSVRVVGIVPDVHETDLEADAGWQIYLSITQGPWGLNATHLVLRSRLPSSAYAGTLMARLRELNADQPLSEFISLQSYVDRSTSPRRFFAILVGLFAALGLLLASLGIYGVISYSVTRQTQEIGIRMALGATREKVQRSVIGRTLRMALLGIAIGTMASFAVASGIRAMLFRTEPTDPWTFAATATLLVGVATLAGYLPARRAARINPMVALRGQ